MSTAEFRLLGAMELRVDGVPVPLPAAAERRLLALLLLTPGRTVSSSSLIDRLWSESTLPADPYNALQLRVSKLRRALGTHSVDLVVREGSGYLAAVDPDSVDVHRFGRLVRAAREESAGRVAASSAALALYDQALELWRGDPLSDFAGDTWATIEAARLDQLRLAAVTERAGVALQLGRHVEVAAELEPLVAQDPKKEALAGLLMTALYRSGRQADALGVYSRTRRALDDELGLDPSAALRSLHQRILEQDPELAPAVAEPVTAQQQEQQEQHEQEPFRPAVPAAAGRALLPTSLVRLIGRQDELAAVADLVAGSRMVTLVGPGGAGKTSLAYAVADHVRQAFAGEVYVTRLGAVTDAADVPLALADAVGVPMDGADATAHLKDRLLAFLSGRRLLLVLDNCEHVIDAAALLAEQLLGAAPDVTLLATSREALGIPGELQFSVGPLAVPPQDAAPVRVLEHAAAQLFVERMRSLGVTVDLTDADLDSLREICRQLDGMPLAIELAAARMTSLSMPELAERLSDRFALLTSGSRTAEARQRTLRATVEWSHALLPEAEQQVFRRLSVFHGGWTLAAAESVCAGSGIAAADVLDLLDHLVSRSMVVRELGRPARFRMLETLRQFAAEELARAGELEQTQGRHADYFRSVADAADAALRGRGQREALGRLRQELPNLRAALSWLAADPARRDEALHLGGALGLFWHLGRHVEGREVLAPLVAAAGGSPAARARALQAVSLVERPRGCLVHPSLRCAETARESLELFLEAGDPRGAALSRVLLAVESVDGSDPQRFEELLDAADATFAAHQDDWGSAVISFVRLQGFLQAGDEQRARATGRAAADAFRALDDPWGLSAVLYHLGWGLREFGEYVEAVPVLEEAIEVSSVAGLHNTAQWALADLGLALLHLDEHEAAEGCFERAAAVSSGTGDAAGEVLARYGSGVAARRAGAVPPAREAFVAAAAGFARLQTPLPRGHALAGVAWCDLQQGDAQAAGEGYSEVRELGQSIHDQALVATALEGLALVAATTKDERRAAELLAESTRIRARSGRVAPPHERAELQRVVRLPV